MLLNEIAMVFKDIHKLFCDNVSVQHMARNPLQHVRIKHIEIDYHL